jgi:DNA-binding MarR family transcriptional regulator
MSNLSLLTLKQLRAFVTVYRMRKLAAAADRLSVTPSAVSVLLRQVEASLKYWYTRVHRRRNPGSHAG